MCDHGSSRPLRSFLLPLACGILSLANAAQAQEIDTLALRAHTRYLASDTLKGRGTGTNGERLARTYIASELERIGVPAARLDGDYFQAVPLKEAEIDTTATRLSVGRNGSARPFQSGRHFTHDRVGPSSLRDMQGDAVLAGTAGLAEQALAGFRRLDGQVIVIIGGLGSEALTLVPDWIERGAEGVIQLVLDADGYERTARGRGTKRIYTAGDVDEPFWQPNLPVVTGGPEVATALLEGAPLAPDALNGEQPFNALPLDRRVELTVRATDRDLDAANVAAMVPGSDPAVRDEVVVYTAHYDHLGIGQPDARGDSIYNGFSDNAAGVAMLLAMAEALVQDPPRRSVLFLFFTGEELGLLGSSYYAANPIIPLDRTAAVINLDAGAPPAPPRNWWLAGGGLSSLGDLGARVAADLGLTAETSNASPNSDHWPFLQRGIPSVFLIPGEEWEGFTSREKEALHQRWDHYHQPGDHWDPEFPFAGLKRYAQLALAIGREAANQP